MILDSSAVIAVLRDEPEAQAFAQVVERSPVVRLSGANALECSIVLGRPWEHLLDSFLEAAQARVEPVTLAQVTVARAAHRKFGRGSGHPARLNFGDCFAYALAQERGEPLLFKGSDFIHTDVQAAG